MRPLLSLSFLVLAIMCGLTRYGLYHSHWTDVAAGFALGLVIAIYMVIITCVFLRDRTRGIKDAISIVKILHAVKECLPAWLQRVWNVKT